MKKQRMKAAAAAVLCVAALSACNLQNERPSTGQAGGERASESASSQQTSEQWGSEQQSSAWVIQGTAVPEELYKAVAKEEKEDVSVVALTQGEAERYLVELSNGACVVYSPETSTREVRGQIARIWLREGALQAPIGLPVDKEVDLPDEAGWSQKFERGTISWERDDQGQYGAKVQSQKKLHVLFNCYPSTRPSVRSVAIASCTLTPSHHPVRGCCALVVVVLIFAH